MLGEDFLNRFGPYRLQDYSVPLYTGGAIGGGPSGGTIPVPTPTPMPTPTPTPTPTPRPGNNNGGQSQHGGSGPGGVGNAGGASHGVGGGGAGDNAGHPGANAASSDAAGFNGGLFGSMGSPNSYLSIGPWGSAALQAAGALAPFPYSLAPTLAGLAMRGWNTANTDAIRSNMNPVGQAPAVPGLDLGQVIGSLLGWNDYGNIGGNQTIVTKDQYRNPLNGEPVGISTGGLSWDSYGPFGLLGSQNPIGMLTPGEDSTKRSMVGLADYLAKERAANAAGGTAPPAHQVYSAPIGPTITGAPLTSSTLSRKEQEKLAAEQALYNAKNGYVAGAGGVNNGIGDLGNDANQIHNNTVAGNQIDKSQSFDVASGTWGAPGGTSNIGAGGSLSSGAASGSITRPDRYAKGGYVRGRSDRIPDNRRIRANEGEFVVRNPAAAEAGPALLELINTPAGARRVRALLGL